jgi:hypothetical protein
MTPTGVFTATIMSSENAAYERQMTDYLQDAKAMYKAYRKMAGTPSFDV